ncbi:Vitellogenin [Bagarius yarrelli]|uniref:Vitellogenin n=1 Tax=Bagarius yarrelli TaxID=175774 RepID=A0A556V325_BAGYA|nr:Vitellogenin [Bagarius yarrelli]
MQKVQVQRHTYRYSTTINSFMKGPTSGGSQLAFDCVVDIDTLPGCPDMLLRLRNPQIKQSLPKRENSVLRLKNIREALEKKPLRFLLQGGKVTALCPQGSEQVWALNIKRAILSMLQTSHSGRVREIVKETDIYGTCISSYELKDTSLVKTRHLQQCLQDKVNDFWPNSVPLKEDRTVNASLKCTQLYGTTMMEKVNCTETVVLLPLPGSLESAQTSTVSTLTLLRTLDGVQVDSGLDDEGYLTDLEFDMEAVKPSPRGLRPVQEISNTVRRLCAHSADQQQKSDLFLSLALQLRTLTPQHLTEVWQEVSYKCFDDWQPLLEALPACGSEACIQFTTNLILNTELDHDHITPFLSTVTFISHPTPSMISNISSLLKVPLIRPKAILAVSSLVHRFCQRERTPCIQIPEVQQLVQVLKEDLRQCCGGQETLPIIELLHVLKGVENIGLPEFIPQLKICIHNYSAPVELRLAAVHAFRHIPCHRKRGVLAWAYQQPHEDVELRIAAYQQLVYCPDQEVFRIIKDTLSNETSTQVGSFVWSHLLNILKTEDPLKKFLLESLPHDIISKDFEAEPWKYSSHMDLTMDTGPAILNMEGALVFSPKSFLPRSAMTNLSAYILGRSFNILEVSLRMENAEPFLWSMFESQQATNNKSPIDQTLSTSHGKKKQTRHEGRWSNQKESANQNVNCKSNILSPFKAESKPHKEFQCWINVKMFGKDLTFMTCDELFGKLRELSLSVAGFTMNLLKGQEVKVNRRAIVLAEELVLPSLSGLPIKININMSSFYSLWVKGNANFKDWSQFSLAGYIKPKTFVGISARIGVDGAFGRVGLEWVTQFKTSTTMDGGIYVHNGQSLKMVLNTPDDVMDILSFRSERMYRVGGESKEELIPRNLKEKTTCSPKTWSKMLGWQLCTDVTYPVLLMGKGFPPSGPIIFSVRLQKLDRVLQKYLLEAAYAFVPQQNSWIPGVNLLIFLGTPQSTVPRDMSLDFSLNPRRLVLKIVHPLKSILFQEDLENMQECHMSQNLRHEVKTVESHYSTTVEHELQCSHVTFFNHKIQLQHQRSPVLIQSSLDLSYGNHWNQGSNKQRLLLSQSIKNQSGEGHTNYAVEVGGFIIAGKRRVNASCSISTAWMPTLRGEISLGNGKELKTLDMSTSYGKENLNISASLNIVDKKLKKKFLMMTIYLSDLNNSYLELEIGGKMEELRKDVNLYQKRWLLHFRQPFKFLPQSLHLQKTFTFDLYKGIYLFESKLLLSDNRKAIHVLKLGFQPQLLQPYVCSSLINSFNLENVPQDLEICISIYKNQSMQVLQGRMLFAKKEKVLVLGQVQLYGEGSSQQGVAIKVNLTQLLQAHLTLEKTPGNSSGSVYLQSDGKINAMLDVFLANAIRKSNQATDFSLRFQQTLFPPIIPDLQLHLSANSSSDSFFVLCALRKSDEMFQAQLLTALKRNPGLQLSLFGDLNMSVSGVSVLPNVSSLAGLLEQAPGAIQGHLMLKADHTVYRVEMRHENSSFEKEINGSESAWICVLGQEKSLCVNISRIFIQHGQNALQVYLAHSFPWLLSAGIPFNTGAIVDVKHGERSLSAELALQAGAQGLKLTIQRGLHNSTEIARHLMVNCMGRIGLDHLLSYCYLEALDQSLRMEFLANLSDSIYILPENQGTLSLLLKILGHHLTPSTGLMANIQHNISSLQPYVPFEFDTKSQLNRSTSSVKAEAELAINNHVMRLKGQASLTKLGFKQVFELYHSLPQLMFVPTSLLVKTGYAWRNDSHVLTHHTQWMDENSPEPTRLEQWNSRQIDEFGPQSHGWELEVRLENETQSKRANIIIDWDLTGAQDQIQATGSWNSEGRQTEAILELKQPFTSILTHLHIQVLSQNHVQGYGRNNQLFLSWDHGKPMNVSVTVNNRSHEDFSMTQACVFVLPGQMQSLLPVVEAHGCTSISQEGKILFSQSAELKWGNSRLVQSMKYQKSDKGMHTVQMETSAENISPGPCSSHTFLAQIHSNLKDVLEHQLLLGLCPPQPWMAGNWSVELGGNIHSAGRNSALQIQVKLDHSELIWLQTTLGKRCLQAAAGYDGDSSDDLRMTLCLEGNHWLTFKTQRGGSGIENETLTLISMGAVDGSLVFRAKGCEACLAATEVRLQQLGTHFKRKLLQKVQRLHHLLLELRRQSAGNEPMQELIHSILHMTRRTENLLLQRALMPWDLWTSGSVRHMLTSRLPRTLQILQHQSQLIQQELKKPLATLAGAYHDVTGEHLDVMWNSLLYLWSRNLDKMLPAVLHNHHLRTPSITAFRTAITALDLVVQHTAQWAESRLAMMLVGFRRQLAFMYKFSERDGELIVSLPVLRCPSTTWSVVNIAEAVVEEFLMKPLISLNSVSLTAELYRLKRKLIDSPFNHQAFLVADEFAVSFGGQVLKIPHSCDLVLAADATKNTFAITLKSDRKEKQHFLILQLQNTTIMIHPNEQQMEVDCRNVHTPFSNPDVTVTRELNFLTVSNKKGLWVMCDRSLSICSVTLNGWLHGISSGLLGTNDNEVGNDYLLPNGSQSRNMDEFTEGWNVEPEQFQAMCERSRCDNVDVPRNSLCKLVLAYVHLCHRNYVPLELPVQCGKSLTHHRKRRVTH